MLLMEWFFWKKARRPIHFPGMLSADGCLVSGLGRRKGRGDLNGDII